MNKLFGLFLLALAFLAPVSADAASKFLIGCVTTCTWDNTNDTIWSTSSGGANNTTHPVAGDDVTLDASSCSGGTTCTITTFNGTISAASITWGACTASTAGCIIEAGTNNTNFTINGSGTTFSGTGIGTRKWNAGTGIYALTSAGFNSCITMQTTTNDTSVFSGATWTCSGSYAGIHNFQGGGKSYGPTTINGNSIGATIVITGANTWSSLIFSGSQTVQWGNGTTFTITGALTVTGSSSAPILFTSNSGDSTYTLSLGAASTATWVALHSLVTSGAAGLTATNCFDLKSNTLANSGSCTAPSVGGGGGGRIIGG